MPKAKEFLGQAARIVILSALAAGTFGVVLAYTTWTGPTAVPPGNNTNAPINIGSGAQVKTGTIQASDFYDTAIGKWLSSSAAAGVTFGGMWEQYSNGVALVNNPWTNGQSCPSFAPNSREAAVGASGNGTYAFYLYYCTN